MKLKYRRLKTKINNMRNINANFLKKLCFSIAFLGLLLGSNFAFAQSTWNGSVSTLWSNGANWTGGVPTAALTATIPLGTPFSPNVDVASNCATLTINAGATLAFNTANTSLTIAGGAAAFTNNGSITGAAATGSAGLIFSATSTMTNNGTVSIGDVTGIAGIVMSAGNLTINGAGSIIVPCVAMTVAGQTITNNSNVTVIGTSAIPASNCLRPANAVAATTFINNGTLTVGNTNAANTSTIRTLTNGAGATININSSGAAFAPVAFNTVAAGNTVNFTCTAAQTVNPNASYVNVGLSGALAKTWATTTTVSGLLTMSGSTTCTAPASLINIGTPATPGTGIILNAGFTGNFTGGGAAITFKDINILGGTLAPGNFVHQIRGNFTQTGGTYTGGTGTLNFNHIAIQNINCTVATIIPNVSINNTVGVTNLATSTGLTINTSLNTTVAATNVFTNLGTLTVSGTVANPTAGATFNIFNSGTTTLSGTTTAANSLNITNNAGGLLNINNGTFTPTSLTANAAVNTVDYQLTGGVQSVFATTYSNLNISTSGNKTAAGVININKDLTISGAATVFAAGANAINITGNWINNAAAFTSGAAEAVTFNGAVPQSIGGTASTTFSNVNANTTGILTSGNITVTNTLTVNGGTTFTPLAAGTVISGAGATITGTGTIEVTYTGAGGAFATQYPFTTSTLAGSTVEYSGAGSQNISHPATAVGTLVTSNSGFKSLSSNVSAGSVIIGIGTTYASNANTLTITTGNLTNNGTFAPVTGGVAFTGAAPQQILGTTGTLSFSDLTLNGAGGVTLTANNINIIGTGSLTLTNGKLITGANKVTAANGAIIPIGSAASHVVGNFENNITTATVKNYPLGDGTVSLPLALTPTTITTGGTIMASATAGNDPNNPGSGLDLTKATLNYWTLTNTSAANINYDLNLNFGTNRAAAAAGLEPTFFAAIYTAGAFHNPVGYGAKNATNTNVTGLSTGSDMGTIQLGVAAAPTASTPANVTQCEGTTVNLTTTGTGVQPLTYQWFRYTGPVEPIPNGASKKGGIPNGVAVVSGATTNTLTITSVDTLDQDNNYYVVVTDGAAQTAQCPGFATLTVNRLPRISAAGQPTALQHACQGGTYTISVTPHGTGPLSYQWYKEGTPIGGAISSSYSIVGVGLGDSSKYYVQVGGACSPPAALANSNNAILVVDTTTNIIAQPTTSQHVCENTTITLTVGANGTGLSYQWYKGAIMLSNGPRISGVNTKTLTISNAIYADADNNYNVVVSGTCAPSPITSNPAAVIVDSIPAITTQPVAFQRACEGSAFNLTVAATGTGLQYQWFSKGAPVSAKTASPNFNIASVTLADSSNSYYVQITGTCGAPLNSSFATLVVDTANVITTPPANTTQCENTSLSLSVVAKGSAKKYQWFRNGSNAMGADIQPGTDTTSTLVINPLKYADAFPNYNVKIMGRCPSVTSANVAVVVDSIPVITVQPTASTTQCENTSFNISVTATGSGLTYQWYRNGGTVLVNGGSISGALTNSLTISPVAPADAFPDYYVIVSGTCSGAPNSTATSTNAKLIVNKKPVITMQPATTTTQCEGTNLSLNVTATGTLLTYQWFRNGGSPIIDGGNISGATTDTLKFTPLKSGDQYSDYYVVVSGTCSGPPNSAATSTMANITVNPGSVINTQPAASQIVCDSASASLTVAATAPGISYTWYRNGSPTPLVNGGHIGGATTATLTINPAVVGMDNFNNYYVVVANTSGCPSAQSNNSAIIINTKPKITVNPTDVVVCEGDTAVFNVTATGSSLIYQWNRNGLALANGAKYVGVDTKQLKIANADSTADNASTYTVTVSNTSCTPITSAPSAKLTVNTPISITSILPLTQTHCVGGTASITVSATGSNKTYVWKKMGATLVDGGAISGATTNTITITGLTAANTGNYAVIVSNGGCASKSDSAAVIVNTPPSIVTQLAIPPNPCVNDTAKLFVKAAGSNLNYQWYKLGSPSTALVNGAKYKGANKDTLYINTIDSAADAGKYFVIISNTGCTAVSSDTVLLQVNTPPAFLTNLPVAPVTVCNNVGNQTFTITTKGTNVIPQWRKNGVNISNGAKYSGVGTNSLTITNVAAADSGQYDVVLTGTCRPPATSNTLKLKVNSTIVIVQQPTNVADCINSTISFVVKATGTSIVYQWRKAGVNLVDGGNISGAKNDTLTISNIQLSDAGSYKVNLTGACDPAPGDSSNAVTLIVNTKPVITGQPTANPNPVCEGNNTSITVTVAPNPGGGSPFTYQWRKDGGPLSNAGRFSGVNTAILNITGVTAADAANYDVIVGIAGCQSDTSNVTALKVSPATFVGNIIGNNEVCPTDNSGSVSLINYQGVITGWEYSEDNGVTWIGTATPPNTSDTQTYTGLTKTTLYRAVLSNGSCNVVKSTIAEIKVNARPVVAFNYQSPLTTGRENAFTDASTVAGGFPNTWSWKFGDGGVSSLKDPTHKYTSEGTYSVLLVVNSNKGCVDSLRKDVTVIPGDHILITNIVTANDNGQNDTFFVEGIKNAEASDLKVFDRNGLEVFAASPYKNDFNGKNDGKDLNDGTYYYVLKITDKGVEKTYKGYITLLK
jgi:gliding motility-associated-like protein